MMLDSQEPRSLIEAAEQAAAAADYPGAERLLREAARLQEARLGPSHPDLANTLNNLGVVYERNGKPADAERSYRRAYAIATAALDPVHPFVTTSGKNLRTFCENHNQPFELPTPAPQPQPIDHVRNPQPGSEGDRPPAGRRQRTARTFPLALVAAGALGLAVLVAAQAWRVRSERGTSSTPGRAADSRTETSSTPQSPDRVRVEPRVEPSLEPPRARAPSTVTTDATGTASRPRQPGTNKPAIEVPAVAVAQICRTLSTSTRGLAGDWQCGRPSVPIDPGVLFFYTRVKSIRDTQVQHRWYRDDLLRQSVDLQILASPNEGFRTYSRSTVDKLGAGDWRVELRAKDGTLLHEERFAVR